MKHNAKTHRPVPLESKTRNGKTAFIDVPRSNKGLCMYGRRSTTNKQELSLQRQEDDALETILKFGFNPDDFEYFIESKSAYNGVKEENGRLHRSRTKFSAMLKYIDESPIPVTLIVYEPSRLSRNDKDAGEITDRLFGEYNKKKKNIAKIIFSNGEIWTPDSDKGMVKQVLLDCYKESLRTSKRSSAASLKELRKGRYILSTPVGISRLRKGENALKTDAKMPYIIKAWEMQAGGKSKKSITAYLDRYGIKIGDSFESYFRKTIYSGFYVDPETGEELPMNFDGDVPPISRKLWNAVQETLGVRRVSKHGEKQEGDFISELLKWEHDKYKNFSVEFHKGKYRSYKNNAYGGFNKSSLKIVEQFLSEAIPKIMRMYCEVQEGTENQIHKQFYENNEILGDEESDYTKEELENRVKNFTSAEKERLEEINKEEMSLQAKMFLLEIGEDLSEIEGLEPEKQVTLAFKLYTKYISGKDITKQRERILNKKKRAYTKCKTESRKLEKEKDALVSLHKKSTLDFGEREYQLGIIVEEKVLEYLKSILNESPLIKEGNFQEEERKVYIKSLTGEKHKKEEEKRLLPINAMRQGYPMEYVNNALEEIQKEIESIDEKIKNIPNSTDLGEFFETIPEVLSKIFELSGKAITSTKIKDIEETIHKLMQLTIFELSVSTKKELTVKLFEGLEDVLNGKNELWLPGLDSNQ